MAALVIQNAVVRNEAGEPFDIIEFNNKRVDIILSATDQIADMNDALKSILLENAMLRLSIGGLNLEVDRSMDNGILSNDGSDLDRFPRMNRISVPISRMQTLKVVRIKEHAQAEVAPASVEETTETPVAPAPRLARLVVG